MKKLLITVILTVLLPAGSCTEKKPEETIVATSEITLSVQGMTCNGCVSSVRTSLENLDGVHSATVLLDSAAAIVEFDASKVGEDDLVKAASHAGAPEPIYDVSVKK